MIFNLLFGLVTFIIMIVLYLFGGRTTTITGGAVTNTVLKSREWGRANNAKYIPEEWWGAILADSDKLLSSEAASIIFKGGPLLHGAIIAAQEWPDSTITYMAEQQDIAAAKALADIYGVSLHTEARQDIKDLTIEASGKIIATITWDPTRGDISVATPSQPSMSLGPIIIHN